MKRFTIALLLLTGAVCANAQVSAIEKKTDLVAQKIKAFYNQKKADSIYALTNADFQSKIKFGQLEYVLTQQLFTYGDITKMNFESNKNGVNVYKAFLGNSAVINLLVGLDPQGKVSTMAFKPIAKDTSVTEKRTNIYHDNALASPLDSLVHRYAMDFLEHSKSPGLAMAILMGTKSFFYNYGDAKKGEDLHPTRNTVFEIGSLTKTFTAYLLADAVVKNKIALDDPITKYLSADLAANQDLQKISILQLANHTSGLPRLAGNAFEGKMLETDPYEHYTDEKLFQYLKQYKAKTKPGEKYEYSNLGFGLLGVILEKLGNAPLEEQYRQVIFGPMKMKSSYAGKIKDSSMTAFGYDASGKQTSYWNFKSMAGAGAIKSTTEDLIRYAVPFAFMPLTKSKYDARTLLLQKITFDKAIPNVSLAWHFNETAPESFTMWHNGGTGGFQSYMSITPSKRLAVVVLANYAGEPGATELGEKLTKEAKKIAN